MEVSDDMEKPKRIEIKRNMVGEETDYQGELHENKDEQVFGDVWYLRKDHQVASTALRKRSVPKSPSVTVKESDTMNSAVNISRKSRPILMHRKTDPFPMREFSTSIVWTCGKNEVEEKKEEKEKEKVEEKDKEEVEEKKMEKEEKEKKEKSKPTIFIENMAENDPVIIAKSIVNERLLVTSFALAGRRLSLPLSKIEPSWYTGKSVSQDLDDTETASNILAKSHHRSSLKQLDHSTMEKKKRRQSAWTLRRPSVACIQDDVSRYLSKRRMSELPALSSLATRRRNTPHILSVPVGLKRKGSRSGSISEFQNTNNASSRAKNEMLATLSVSSWLDKINPFGRQEISRRKSCHTGFGVMALKKKEEKRLMVAHEILQTEKNYIKALETLHEVFIEPLKNSCIIPLKDIRILFPMQLLAMRNGHVQFMNELEERLNNWKWQDFLGDIFAKLGNSCYIDFLTVYAEYVQNFPKAIAILNKYSRNSQKFKKLIEKCNNDPRCERLNISAFLLTPIQRLPRYVLLLRQLSKYTECNHPDSFNIEITLKKMIDIINILNSSIQNSTRIARNTSQRQSSRRRRKRAIFKTKESVHPEFTSLRKSSDESELSEVSSLSSPCANDLQPLTLDTSSADQQNRSSDYGSLSNSEPTSPVPSSGSSSKGNIFKVIRRSGGDSRKRKTCRPLSSTEVEINCRKNDIIKHDVLKRSASRDSFGSFIRQKFGSLRGKQRSNDDDISRDVSLEKLNDCKINLFKRGSCQDEGSLREEEPCTNSESDLPEEEQSFHSRERFSCSRSNSDSEDSSLTLQETSATRLNFDSDSMKQYNTNNNQCDKSCSIEKKLKRKIPKQNRFTNVVKHFFATKTRSSSSSPETVKVSENADEKPKRIVNSGLSKEKCSTV